jgi:hypothetical protein
MCRSILAQCGFIATKAISNRILYEAAEVIYQLGLQPLSRSVRVSIG